MKQKYIPFLTGDLALGSAFLAALISLTGEGVFVTAALRVLDFAGVAAFFTGDSAWTAFKTKKKIISKYSHQQHI